MNAALATTLREHFGLYVEALEPARGGADVNATLWRATDVAGATYAVKHTRSGSVAGLLVPAHLAAAGVRGVPAPVPAGDGRLWAEVDSARLSVTPWVDGRSGLSGGLTPRQWRALGALLGAAHRLDPPPALRSALPAETYRCPAAQEVLAVAARLQAPDADELSAALRAVWLPARPQVEALVARTADLGERLRGRAAAGVVCHNDPHLGNVIVDDEGGVWLLDWDDVVLAPRERDLVLLHDWVLGDSVVGPAELGWFLEGYGDAAVDPELLAYFTAVRGIEECTWASQVLDAGAADDQRAFALRIVRWQLSPSGVPATALRRLGAIGA